MKYSFFAVPLIILATSANSATMEVTFSTDLFADFGPGGRGTHAQEVEVSFPAVPLALAEGTTVRYRYNFDATSTHTITALDSRAEEFTTTSASLSFGTPGLASAGKRLYLSENETETVVDPLVAESEPRIARPGKSIQVQGTSNCGSNFCIEGTLSQWVASVGDISHSGSIDVTARFTYSFTPFQSEDFDQQDLELFKSGEAVANAKYESEPFHDFLRGVYVFTNGTIGGFLPNDGGEADTDIPVGNLGIRGDARDIVRKDVLDNPAPLFGDVGLWIETGSPAGASTLVDVPDEPVDFSFMFTFLNDDTSLDVLLGGSTIFSLRSDQYTLGEENMFSAVLDWESWTSELSFVADGPTGSSVLVWDILLDSDDLISGTWMESGEGSVSAAYITSDAQLASAPSSVSAVPLPSGLVLLASGLVFFGLIRRTDGAPSRSSSRIGASA